VLLECLTGERAFEGSGIEAAAARLIRDPVIPEHLGETWCALLTEMTKRVAASRPDARDVAQRLRDIVAGRELGADPTLRLPPVQPPSGGFGDGMPRRIESITGTSPSQILPAAATAVATPAVAFSTAPGTTVGTAPDSTVQTAPGVLPGAAPATQTAPTAVAAAPRRRRRGTAILLAVVVLLLVIGAAVWAAVAMNTPAPQEPVPAVEYPRVDGDLGRHLEQLQDSVTP
jgi:eukaryotic-like serine/threonine-protein kinase